MHHSTIQSHTSIGRDFMAFGPEAIGTHRAQERRLQQIHTHRAAALTGSTSPIRQWLGATVISLGTAIAGGAAIIQECQQAAPARKTGPELAPTR